eukprot:131723-Chlamydomonas_euryale.AAC.2
MCMHGLRCVTQRVQASVCMASLRHVSLLSSSRSAGHGAHAVHISLRGLMPRRPRPCSWHSWWWWSGPGGGAPSSRASA